jgi:hypothetical protein
MAMSDVIRFPRGDRRVIRFVVPEPLRANIDRIFFMIKRFIWQDDEQAFFSLNTVDDVGIFVAGFEPGEYFIELKSELTEAFPLGRHISSIRLLDTFGETHTLGSSEGESNFPVVVEIVTQHEVTA